MLWLEGLPVKFEESQKTISFTIQLTGVNVKVI